MSTVVCFQAEDGIRDLVRSRGLGDVYKRQRFLDAGERFEAAGRPAVFQQGIETFLKLVQVVGLSLIHL